MTLETRLAAGFLLSRVRKLRRGFDAGGGEEAGSLGGFFEHLLYRHFLGPYRS